MMLQRVLDIETAYRAGFNVDHMARTIEPSFPIGGGTPGLIYHAKVPNSNTNLVVAETWADKGTTFYFRKFLGPEPIEFADKPDSKGQYNRWYAEVMRVVSSENIVDAADLESLIAYETSERLPVC